MRIHVAYLISCYTYMMIVALFASCHCMHCQRLWLPCGWDGHWPGSHARPLMGNGSWSVPLVLSCPPLAHSWVVIAGVAAAGTPVANVAIQLLCTCPSGHSRVVAAFGWYSCHRSGLSPIQGSWCREVGGVTTYAVAIISAGCLLMLLLLIYAAVVRLCCCCLFMLLCLHRWRFIPVICV